MKTVRLFLVVVLSGAFGAASYGQTVAKASTQQKTGTFKVLGNCDLCKARIEKTVKVNGVTSAEWTVSSNMLKVTFDPGKTNIDALEKTVASVGHDTQKFKTPDEVYTKLPVCCKYIRSKSF